MILRKDVCFTAGSPLQAVMMTGLPIANEGGLMSVVLQQFLNNFAVD